MFFENFKFWNFRSVGTNLHFLLLLNRNILSRCQISPCFVLHSTLDFNHRIITTISRFLHLLVCKQRRDRIVGRIRVGDWLDHELALGGSDPGYEGVGGADEGEAAGDGAEGRGAGDGGVEEEAVEVDELAELEAVGEDEVGVAVREGDVGGVEGVGELDEEAVVGPEVGGAGRESGDDADHLEERGAVVAGDFGGGVDGLEELEEDSWSESRHGWGVLE